MEFDFRTLPRIARYKIINSTVTPRPIAWVTTQSADGVVNAAPYSFFNAVGDDPPMIVLGLMKHHIRLDLKDTGRNIADTGEFVVNLVCEDDAEAMNLTSVDAPREVSEARLAKLQLVPSSVVKPPRIATSPVSFECRRHTMLEVGNQHVVLGEILMVHVRDEFVQNPEKHYLDTPAMKLLGRTHGTGWYVRNSDAIKLERPQWDPKMAEEG